MMNQERLEDKARQGIEEIEESTSAEINELLDKFKARTEQWHNACHERDDAKESLRAARKSYKALDEYASAQDAQVEKLITEVGDMFTRLRQMRKELDELKHPERVSLEPKPAKAMYMTDAQGFVSEVPQNPYAIEDRS